MIPQKAKVMIRRRYHETAVQLNYTQALIYRILKFLFIPFPFLTILAGYLGILSVRELQVHAAQKLQKSHYLKPSETSIMKASRRCCHWGDWA